MSTESVLVSANDESIIAPRVYKLTKRKKLSPTSTTMLLEYALGILVERPLIPAVSFDINMRDADAVLSFRFDVSGVLQLTSLLECMNLQKRTYSGHKRMHCLNFQGLTTPDGLCIHFFRPLEGSRHDVTLLRVSQLQEYFEANSDIFDGYYIYGDPAYPISKWIVSGYKGNNLDAQKQSFNTAMSRVRQGVE
ncbi:hypothetical protein H310_09560 [Aphanomyces invadans]|uniref:DDE Tnp4 domain-containing protein n=1 Tax=Aphanomyces invadans TaxID=157072 RepID=A0A024TUH3_9STRA|nr:hypothetical protein H310_09560 [Aphanomyces invadans]ETV97673.1 hypothetical protein H310_09560 [Aphanomyces invadans]|eukprot:XP_008873882.1 hypothetical protein H310_09560 [Aphanomyces invadans]